MKMKIPNPSLKPCLIGRIGVGPLFGSVWLFISFHEVVHTYFVHGL